MLLLALLGCLLTACSGQRPGGAPEQAYRILQFDSEGGQFDARMSAADRSLHWQQWKKTRRIHVLLNPDDAHGRQCGTHPYLQATGVLQTRFIPDYTIFLVRPGRRPCDYDEACEPAVLAPVTCAHTQSLLDYPVVIGPRGNLSREALLDRDLFNVLIRSRTMTIDDAVQAEQVARLYLFLTTTGRRNAPVEIESVEARPEGRHFKVRARLRTGVPPESSVQFFDVAADGRIVVDN
jgi:hypothetical protein